MPSAFAAFALLPWASSRLCVMASRSIDSSGLRSRRLRAPNSGGRSCGWITPVRRRRTTWRRGVKTRVAMTGPAAAHDLAQGLENLLDIAGPVGAHQHLQYFRREGELALVAEPRDEEGRELLDVLDMVTQRGYVRWEE